MAARNHLSNTYQKELIQLAHQVHPYELPLAKRLDVYEAIWLHEGQPRETAGICEILEEFYDNFVSEVEDGNITSRDFYAQAIEVPRNSDFVGILISLIFERDDYLAEQVAWLEAKQEGLGTFYTQYQEMLRGEKPTEPVS